MYQATDILFPRLDIYLHFRKPVVNGRKEYFSVLMHNMYHVFSDEIVK